MTRNIADPFSQLTDEQLLELSCQRDTLLDRGSAQLDQELTQRGYDPDASSAASVKNYGRLFSSYSDAQLHEAGKTRHHLSREGIRAFDHEVESRRLLRKIAHYHPDKTGQAETGPVKSFFLRARSWQIFLLLFGSGICSSVLRVLGMTPETVHSWKDLSPLAFAGITLEELGAIFFIAWLWAIGSFASELVHPIARPKPNLLTFSLIYIGSFALLLLLSFNLLLSDSWLAFVVLLPLGLVFGFCVFYTMFFTSKVLVLAGIFKPGPIFDYLRPFILIWVYPVGVWVIQPKINRLFAQPIDSAPHSS